MPPKNYALGRHHKQDSRPVANTATNSHTDSVAVVERGPKTFARSRAAVIRIAAGAIRNAHLPSQEIDGSRIVNGTALMLAYLSLSALRRGGSEDDEGLQNYAIGFVAFMMRGDYEAIADHIFDGLEQHEYQRGPLEAIERIAKYYDERATVREINELVVHGVAELREHVVPEFDRLSQFSAVADLPPPTSEPSASPSPGPRMTSEVRNLREELEAANYHIELHTADVSDLQHELQRALEEKRAVLTRLTQAEHDDNATFAAMEVAATEADTRIKGLRLRLVDAEATAASTRSHIATVESQRDISHARHIDSEKNLLADFARRKGALAENHERQLRELEAGHQVEMQNLTTGLQSAKEEIAAVEMVVLGQSSKLKNAERSNAATAVQFKAMEIDLKIAKEEAAAAAAVLATQKGTHKEKDKRIEDLKQAHQKEIEHHEAVNAALKTALANEGAAATKAEKELAFAKAEHARAITREREQHAAGISQANSEQNTPLMGGPKQAVLTIVPMKMEPETPKIVPADSGPKKIPMAAGKAPPPPAIPATVPPPAVSRTQQIINASAVQVKNTVASLFGGKEEPVPGVVSRPAGSIGLDPARSSWGLRPQTPPRKLGQGVGGTPTIVSAADIMSMPGLYTDKMDIGQKAVFTTYKKRCAHLDEKQGFAGINNVVVTDRALLDKMYDKGVNNALRALARPEWTNAFAVEKRRAGFHTYMMTHPNYVDGL